MATSTSMRRKLLGLIMLGAKMNENHDERGRFSLGSGEGSGSPDVLHLASNPMDKKARVSRSDLEAGSGSGGKKPLGYTPLSNEESGARHEAEKLREHLGTAGSGGGRSESEPSKKEIAQIRSDRANELTEEANNLSRKADTSGTVADHRAAATAHADAGNAHTDAANAYARIGERKTR